MNGSSQLEEADQKPFALCPVCLRKMSSYLGFNGEELELYTEMKDVFELMNHKDQQQNFGREIKLFDRIQKKLVELYNNAQEKNNWSAISVQEAEGGKPEAINRLNMKGQLLKKDIVLTNQIEEEMPSLKKIVDQ